MKRKPLKFRDQWRQVQFHTHQRSTEHMCAGAHYVSLPEVPSAEDVDQSASSSGAQVVVKQETDKNVRAGGGEVPATSQMMQARSNLPAGTGTMIAGNPNITTTISSGSSGMVPSSTTTMGQHQGMQQQQATNDQRQRMTLLEQSMRDENRRMMMGNVTTGISPLPPQFNQTSITQQAAQSQIGRPGGMPPPHQVMPPQQQPNLVRTPMMYQQPQQPMQSQQQQHHQLQALSNYFTPQQKKQFTSLSADQKRMVVMEARQRMMQHIQQVRLSQQQPQHQQRIISRPQQMMQFRQPMPQSGPLHANPPMPMQQIIQQRQHGFPGHPHPGVPGPGQHYMMRPSMYQQGPGPGGMPFPRAQHNMHF